MITVQPDCSDAGLDTLREAGEVTTDPQVHAAAEALVACHDMYVRTCFYLHHGDPRPGDLVALYAAGWRRPDSIDLVGTLAAGWSVVATRSEVWFLVTLDGRGVKWSNVEFMRFPRDVVEGQEMTRRAAS